MRFLILLLFPCLPFTTGRELDAQGRHECQQNIISETFSSIVSSIMSEDGRWLVVRKRSKMQTLNDSVPHKDTILILDLSKPGVTATRDGSWRVDFAGTSNLLFSNALETELFNPVNATSVYYYGVKKVLTLKRNGCFLLHYKEDEDNRLELRDNSGELINLINNVSYFYSTGSDNIYAITNNGKDECKIFRLKDKISEELYFSTHKITSLETDPGENGIMIYTEDQQSNLQEMQYLNLKTKSVHFLNTNLSISVERGFSEVIREGKMYFLRLWIPAQRQNNGITDIWYGNDNQLEVKFSQPIQEVDYIWEPDKNNVQRVGTDMIMKVANMRNENYFLVFNPYLLQDYTKATSYKIYVYNQYEGSYSLMDTISGVLHTSPDGQCVLYKKDKNWYAYHIITGTNEIIGGDSLITPCFPSDGKTVLFEGDGGIWRYDFAKKKLLLLNSFKGYRVSILNKHTHTTLQGFNFYEKSVNLKEPLVLKLYDAQENKSTFLLWENGKHRTIISSTTRYIQSFNYNKSYDCFSWVEEDYNLPPRLVYKKIGKEEKVLYQSNKADSVILNINQEVISYTNSEGVPMRGILYYPIYFDPSREYPMVVHIYEKQSHLANRYLYPSYFEGLGFNIRLLIEKGYFVYLPDIIIQGKNGPGMDALDCVNNALDAIAGNVSIDKQRIGLIGHSFGGYETDFIATHSNRFAAYVSGSGQSDILWAYYSFNNNFKWPDYMRLESGQYRMNVSFTENKDLYFKNNPIFNAEKVNAPVLLWSGLEDKNVTSDQSMAFYNSLRRNKKNVIALFYKGEMHSLLKQQAQCDLTYRILDWFDYFLKGETDFEWISMGINWKDAP
jgi:dipeptidyl aminopeptidase/acylaminoacyl peptidase